MATGSRCRFAVAAMMIVCAASVHADELRLPGLAERVEVYFDTYAVPHIYAASWTDAATALGYLHARERLWQMDMFRRQASGTTAEVVGADGVKSDTQMRQLGIRRGCEELFNSDAMPDALRAELEAYAVGVNHGIEAQRRDGLSIEFRTLKYEPHAWTPVDSIVFTKYMGWDQSGTMDDLWFGMMTEKLGVAAVEELWPLERPYEIPTVKVQADRHQVTAAQSAAPLPRGLSGLYDAVRRNWPRVYGSTRGDSFGSNNWAVDGSKTHSGKSILANDPHLGFSLPAIWYTCHLSVAGENVAGVSFPGCPVVIIGHNDQLGWGLTNMQSDSVDYYVETIDPDDPSRYRHRGEWKQLERRTEEIAVRDAEPQSLVIESTVHGPIISREDRTVSMAWTGLGPTTELVSIWKMSRSRNLAEFLDALDLLVVPAMNVVYADAAGNIAIHPAGSLPLRTRGRGRIAMDGASGNDDWQGMIPRDELPLAVNPPDHFVASANNRPSPLGYPHYLGWMWDPSYRVRRINDMLAAADDLTVESMQRIQLDAHDKAAEVFLPPLLEAVAADPPTDALARRLYAELSSWDFVADIEAVAPMVWMRWLTRYREAVWDDEWEARGIEKTGGSWGFTGNNGREPMLEVLEYMTREHPQSIWFDDRRTPQRETRDDIARRTFTAAVAELQAQLGDDLTSWRWGQINQLRISHLSGVSLFGREGGPVPGTAFTVNPGSRGGHVGGGASWRMIVDFATPGTSVGVYPGGQSGSPASPHYADQMPIWAGQQYLPIHMLGSAQELPAEARVETLVLLP